MNGIRLKHEPMGIRFFCFLFGSSFLVLERLYGVTACLISKLWPWAARWDCARIGRPIVGMEAKANVLGVGRLMEWEGG